MAFGPQRRRACHALFRDGRYATPHGFEDLLTVLSTPCEDQLCSTVTPVRRGPSLARF